MINFDSIKKNKPLWVRLVFETPEFIYDSLLLGKFPELRKKIIDVTTKGLLFCHKRKSFPISLKIESKILSLIEWINNHWTKKID